MPISLTQTSTSVSLHVPPPVFRCSPSKPCPYFFIRHSCSPILSNTSVYICYLIKVNGVEMYTLYDTLDQNVDIVVKHLVFENPCRAKIDFSPALPATISGFTASYSALSVSSYFIINVLNAGKIKLLINHTLATSTSTSKVTVTISTFSDSKCLTFCEVKPYTSGKGIIGVNICNCIPGYVWNNALLRCEIDCRSIPYTVGLDGISSCTCVTKFLWDSTQLKCIIDCSPANIPHVVALSPGSIDVCTCATQSIPAPGTVYFWMQSSLSCVYQVDCDAAVTPYATGAGGTIDSCTCEAGFTFTAGIYKCVRDCSTASYSSSTGLPKPGSLYQCICPLGLYYKLDNRLCVNFPPNCISCIHYTYPPSDPTPPTASCTQCVDNTFELYSRPFPTICRQRCGDGITSPTSVPLLLCDNEKGRPYDGCNDYCEVENDFNCTVTGGATKCSFNGTLMIQFVSFTKSSDDNSMEIKVKISPPLYILRMSDEAQIKRIFSLSSQKVAVTGVALTFPSSLYAQLTISAQLLADIYSPQQQFLIKFDPSSSSFASDHYFSTVTQNLLLKSSSIPLPMYMYSSLALLCGKLLPTLSCIVCVLGWIGFVLGVLMRRLAGLQAMFVLQFSWLPILWLNAYILIPLRSMKYMKYSGGYNYPFITQTYAETYATSLQSSSYPHVSVFELSGEYLLNNYSFLPILLVIALVLYLIAAIRLRKHVLAHPNINIDALQMQISNQHDDSTDVPITPQLLHLLAVNKQYEYSIQALMQAAMSNLVYFLSMGGLFIRYSSRTSVISFVVFALVAVATILVLIKLYRDPCPFDYFRTSFRTNLLAVNHYYIHVAVLTISVVLLTAVPEYAASALALCLVMFVFTLAFKPYRMVKQNYRSGFNYFVMCCAIGLKVYLQYVPSDKFNSMFTYIYALVLVCLMLPAVAILGLVSTIYYWFYYRYIKPKEDEEAMKTKQFSDERKRRRFLNQLNIVSVRDRIKKIKQQTVFKELVPPSINLIDYSNYIKDQQLLKQEQKMIKDLTSSRPICVDNKDQSRILKQKKIRQQLKMHKKKRKQLKVNANSSGEKLYKQIESPKVPIVRNGEIMDSQNMSEEVSSNYSTRKMAQGVLDTENKYINYKGSVEYTQKNMKKPDGEEWTNVYQEAYNQIDGV